MGNSVNAARSVSQPTHGNSVDVRLVAREGLFTDALSDVPELSRRVTGTGHEGSQVGGEGQGHHVPSVPCELRALLTRLYVPESTAHEGKHVSLPRTHVLLPRTRVIYVHL